jgi:hypothetical protein
MTAPTSFVSIEDLAAQVARLTATVDALDTAVSAANATAPGDDGGEPAELCYPDLTTFVEAFWVPMFSRPIGGEFRWCTHWWDHVEAVLRLEALWRAFEHLRLDPQTGIAVWLRDHVDHQLPRLMAPTGPFARCAPDRQGRPHEPDRPLPVTAPPTGWPDRQ